MVVVMINVVHGSRSRNFGYNCSEWFCVGKSAKCSKCVKLEMFLFRLRHLNTWYPFGGAVWGGLVVSIVVVFLWVELYLARITCSLVESEEF